MLQAEKLPGVTADSELKLENHITELCFKGSKRLNAPCCISSFVSLEKRKTLMKAFTETEFNYCLLLWMLHPERLNNKIKIRIPKSSKKHSKFSN